MTPKEKAEELIFKFIEHTRVKMGQEDYRERAKLCALTCCDEVLGYMGADRGTDFWKEVKRIIQEEL